MSEYTCPKCNGTMRSYERNGINIEQCSDCRGVFLDRGELDQMIDAESRRYEQPARVAQPVRQTVPQYRDDHQYKKKKKRGFLSEMFDD